MDIKNIKLFNVLSCNSFHANCMGCLLEGEKISVFIFNSIIEDYDDGESKISNNSGIIQLSQNNNISEICGNFMKSGGLNFPIKIESIQDVFKIDTFNSNIVIDNVKFSIEMINSIDFILSGSFFKFKITSNQNFIQIEYSLV